jgi:hypothetical protein
MYRCVVASDECPARCWMMRGCTPARANSVMNQRRPECPFSQHLSDRDAGSEIRCPRSAPSRSADTYRAAAAVALHPE